LDRKFVCCRSPPPTPPTPPRRGLVGAAGSLPPPPATAASPTRHRCPPTRHRPPTHPPPPFPPQASRPARATPAQARAQAAPVAQTPTAPVRPPHLAARQLPTQVCVPAVCTLVVTECVVFLLAGCAESRWVDCLGLSPFLRWDYALAGRQPVCVNRPSQVVVRARAGLGPRRGYRTRRCLLGLGFRV
jgi:hypothetical protein